MLLDPPYVLAAEDGLLNCVKPDADADSLCQQMLNQRIEHPEKLERLYTVAPPRHLPAETGNTDA